MMNLFGCDMLTLICGIPNAGKTTGYPDALHIDEIGFAHAREIIKCANDDVVIEGNFPTPSMRRGIRTAYGGYAKCVFIDISADESIRREDRGRPDWMLRNVAQRFVTPTYDEGWDEIEVVR